MTTPSSPAIRRKQVRRPAETPLVVREPVCEAERILSVVSTDSLARHHAVFQFFEHQPSPELGQRARLAAAQDRRLLLEDTEHLGGGGDALPQPRPMLKVELSPISPAKAPSANYHCLATLSSVVRPWAAVGRTAAANCCPSGPLLTPFLGPSTDASLPCRSCWAQVGPRLPRWRGVHP